MGNQRRDDIGNRDEAIAQGNTAPYDARAAQQQGQGGFQRTVTQPGGWYERGRNDLRRRRDDPPYERNGYTSAGPQGGNVASGRNNYEPSQYEEPVYRGREYDSYAQNTVRDDRTAGYYPTAQGAYYPPSMQRTMGNDPRPFPGGDYDRFDRDRERQVRPRTSHDHDAQAYGDYGHPGGMRSAYGDMGAADRQGGFVQRTGAGITDRVRRWRKGASTAHDVMTRNPKSVKPSDSLQHVAQIMIDEDTGIVPVIEDGDRLVGVITDRDIVCRLLAKNVDMRAAKAADAMTDDVECVTQEHSLHDVLDIMSEKQVRRVPVVAKGDRLVGIISMSDIAREADVDTDLQDTFEDISSRRGFWSRLR